MRVARAGRSLPRFILPVAALVLIAVLAAPRSASAEWQLAPYIGFTFGGDTNLIDLERAAGRKRVMYGGMGTYMTEGLFGLQVDFGFHPGFFQSDEPPFLVTSSSLVTLTGNIVLALPKTITRESLRPYVSGGAGLIRPRVDDFLGAFPVDGNLLGLSVGGGAVGFITERTGVQWDFRRFRTIKGTDESGTFPDASTRLSFWRLTTGIVIRY